MPHNDKSKPKRWMNQPHRKFKIKPKEEDKKKARGRTHKEE